MFKKPDPLSDFTVSVKAIEALRARVTQTKCPACLQQTLRLHKYTNAVKGWDAEILCDNCNLLGVVNSTGFEFKGLSRRVKKE
jgi:hypothetical protein